MARSVGPSSPAPALLSRIPANKRSQSPEPDWTKAQAPHDDQWENGDDFDDILVSVCVWLELQNGFCATVADVVLCVLSLWA